ncbi:MAG: L,D-transpeptidase [Rhizobacter sp.]|nr:L,D-transpeptidase [Ferruginibacter sp.]
MKRITRGILILFTIVLLVQCTDKTAENKTGGNKGKPSVKRDKSAISFRFDSTKNLIDTLKKNNDIARIVAAVNRTDYRHLLNMDTIVVPDDLSKTVENYLPFPLQVPYLKDVDKIVYFSYPSQSFAAYEFGELVYTGQTNMGSKAHPTPPQLYFTNWKAEETVSTFNDEWELRWNFNIENKEGIGWHQYELPGYPASHSCLRMTERDAKYMYEWADQWKLKGTDNVIAKGIPAIVFGAYNFDGPKPWLQIVSNPKALEISAAAIENETATYLNEIVKEQKNRLQQKSVN